MPSDNAELVLGDIDGIGIATTPRYALKVRVSFDAVERAHNAAAILLGRSNKPGAPAPEGLVAVMRDLFDSLVIRTAAADALRAIEADEDAEAERELEEQERRDAVSAGPHLACGGPCCAEG